MSFELKLNFYDEVITIPFPKKYDFFKNEIGRLYAIDPSDVDELIVYFFDSQKVKKFIRDESEFIQFQSLKGQFIVYLEIHEESKLFKKEQINKDFDADKLKKEIMEKEALLKQVIEKEKQEIQRKKEEAKKKLDDDSKKKRLEDLRQKKLNLEKEEKLRQLKEKEEFEAEVSRVMNENIEKLRESLIKSTIQQSFNVVDKQNERRLTASMCKIIHRGITCSACSSTPIIGVRFSCPINRDFNLCETCENLLGDSHPYPLLKYRSDAQSKVNLKIEIAKELDNKPFIKPEEIIPFETMMNKFSK